jgi:tetratricopeptide (TPR) repeat protein
MQQQLLEEARAAYLKAIECDPKYVPAYLALARLHQRCGDSSSAQAVFEQALKADPRDPRLWFEVGMCQGRADDWNSAVLAFQNSCDLDPANRQYSTTLGFSLARIGRYEEGFVALARHNGEARAHYDLARLLLHQQQLPGARQQASLATQLDPSLSAARDLLALVEQKLGGQQAAVQTTSSVAPSVKHGQWASYR